MRRAFLAQACAAGVLAMSILTPVIAQGKWPTRPIRIVVPYPPGTGPDVMARVMTESWGKELMASVVVENKPGASSILGTTDVVKSPADGHTFLLVDRLTLSVNPLLYKPPYDAKKDLVSVSNIADVNLYLVTSSKLPVSDFSSFIAHAKANPGKVTFGTGGVGSIMHLNMEMLQAGTGAEFLHVPYKALAEVVPGMLGGQVDATSGGAEALLPHVQLGTMRLLAVGATSRQAVAPNVPTIMEAGGSDMLLSTSFSFHARAGTPKDILDRMNAALTKVLSRPELKNWAAERGLNASGSTPADLDALIANDSERVGRLIRERGIKVQ